MEYKNLCKGHELPKDGFLLGSNHNGDLHIRSAMSAELVHHKRFSLFYYPAPSLSMPKSTYKTIFENILSHKNPANRSSKFDHSGLNDLKHWEKELDRMKSINKDDKSIIGLKRFR